MKSKLYLVLGAVSLLVLITLAACSSDSPTIGVPVPPGDPNDPNFDAVQDFTEVAGLGESWERSVDLTFSLLDFQFPSPSSERRWGLPEAEAAQDIVIDSATYFYSGTTGWHIWDAYFTVTDGPDVVDALATDSLRIWALGEAQSAVGIDTLGGLEDIDSLQIRTHFQWFLLGTLCTGRGDHTISISTTPFGTLGALVLNASAAEQFNAGPGCIDDSCTLEILATSNFNDVTFPFELVDSSLETAECPVAGDATISESIDLQCTGTSDSGYDSLSVNGTWTVTFTVLSNGDVRVSYNDGGVAWTYTDTCSVSTPTRAAPALRWDQ